MFNWAVEQAKAGIETSGVKYRSDSGIKELVQRNVVSRVLFFASTALYVAEKITHLAIGAILSACAAATLFSDKDLNDAAYKYLGALDVVDEVLIGARAVVYPWQNLGKEGAVLSKFRNPEGNFKVVKEKEAYISL